jgi:signal transduction histidine kinase
MEAVGQLARGIAHDFNNVLAAIVGCCDLLALRLAANEPARIDAEEIRKAAERGAALTRQLLTFSRGQAVEPQVLDVHAIARGFESMLLRLMSDGVKLQLETPGAPPLVRVEPGQIEQVLLNLVVNARDAMPEGGTIVVRIDAIALDAAGALQYPAMPAGRYARMAVRDTGLGIDPDVQRHVFEPFFTTKGSKGTGLGLSIVYGIAKEAGGSVTFSTAPNLGTTFEVLLPLVEPA